MQLRRVMTHSLCLLTGYASLYPNSVTWADAGCWEWLCVHQSHFDGQGTTTLF